jgi:hypothetical protein
MSSLLLVSTRSAGPVPYHPAGLRDDVLAAARPVVGESTARPAGSERSRPHGSASRTKAARRDQIRKGRPCSAGRILRASCSHPGICFRMKVETSWTSGTIPQNQSPRDPDAAKLMGLVHDVDLAPPWSQSTNQPQLPLSPSHQPQCCFHSTRAPPTYSPPSVPLLRIRI